MSIDSNLYIDFHRYIDVISCNKDYFKIEHLNNIKQLKSIYSIREPSINIHDYIDRIIQFINRKDIYIDGIIINAIVLIKRAIRNLIVNKYNIHRLIAGILMISQKIYQDNYYSNKYWSVLCGLELYDINNIELDILKTIDFNTFIKREEMLGIVKCIKYL